MPPFETWYREQHPALLVALTILTSDLEVARDVTAEAFSRALERWDVVGAMDNPAGWTYVVAVNLLRRRWRLRRIEVRAARMQVPDPPAALTDARVDVFQAVRSLPERARTAVILRYFGGLSEADVAEAMGVAVGTASAHLAQARNRLSLLLADYMELP